MLRGLAGLVVLGVVLLAAPSAEARIFAPQPNWWSSGATCVASRYPPARRWRALPPRTCAGSEHMRDDASSVYVALRSASSAPPRAILPLTARATKLHGQTGSIYQDQGLKLSKQMAASRLALDPIPF